MLCFVALLFHKYYCKQKIRELLRVLRIEDVINEIVLKATPLVLSQQTGSSLVKKGQN